MWKEVIKRLIDYQIPDRVGGQVVKVSIVWLQGSLVLGNLAVLFTSLVQLPSWPAADTLDNLHR